MAVGIGARLSAYEIIALLGAGGMGEVYRARDTKLNRDVALKILPEAFAIDGDRIARFRREAQVLASFNHPNIAAIYGFEDSGSTHALVLELVEGPTLADRIGKGPIPLDEALPIAKQIAEALEAAHEQGIIHRDLKPANIKVRDDGTVKVLDFGLAKALEPASAISPALTASPTITTPAQMTGVGMILGTAAYMSPEQARGRPADKRSDIWSFGAVLWEMLSGRPAFAGESVSDTLASVLKLDPDWNALPPSTPSSIRKLIRRCLTKDRNQRLQAIGEARIELENPTTDEASSARSNAALLPWVIAALTTVTAVVALWAWLRPVAQPHQVVVRFADAVPIADQGAGLIALSRDGSRVAFVGGPQRQIYVRKMDQLEPTPLSGTDNSNALSFSPDGEWISYVSGRQSPDSKIKKISVAGGPAQVLANAPSEGGPPFQSWGEDDNIYFSITNDVGLHRVPSSGGKDEVFAIRDPKKGDTFIWSAPQLLPDRKHVLVSTLPIGRGANGHRLATIDLQTGERKLLLDETGIAVYAATGTTPASGHLLYYVPATSSIMAVAFDVNRLEARGSPVPVLEGVRATAGGVGSFAFSESGSLAYVPGSGGESAARTLVWVDRQGVEQPTSCPGPRQFNLPRLSPSGDRVAFEIQNPDRGQADVWVCDLTRGTLSRITSDKSNIKPLFLPDGKRVIYRVSPGDTLVAAPIDGGTPVAVGNVDFLPDSVFPDGTALIGRISSNPAGNVAVLSIEQTTSSNATAQPLETKLTGNDIQFSPDGKWIAYASREGGRNEIYLQAYPGPGGKTTISTDGGTNPRWSRSGELFYRSGSKVMAVEIQATPVLRVGKPTLLFDGRYGNGYDVTADGKRFLMVKSGEARPATTNQLNIVLNWMAELKQRVPSK